jgi:hypothetical protein
MKKFQNILILIILFIYSGFGIDYSNSSPDFDANSISRISIDYSKSNTIQFKNSNFLNALEEESEPEKVVIFTPWISNFTIYTILIKSVYSPFRSNFLNVVLFESDSSPPIKC